MNIDWQIAAAISEVIGAIAVVISLIYLAFQVRQNTRALRGATLDAITDHQQDELRWSAEMARAWQKVLQAPDSLTFEESWEVSEWLHAAFTARQNEYFQFRHGLLDEEVWLASAQIIRLLMSIEWVRNWWAEHGRNTRSGPFIELVESFTAANNQSTLREIEAAFRPERE